jgi:hypothetical protein
MQDKIGIFYAFEDFITDHYEDIKKFLEIVLDRAENGLVARIFPNSKTTQFLRNAIPKIKVLLSFLERIKSI